MLKKVLQASIILIAYTVYTWSRVFLPVVLVEVMQEFSLDVALAGLLSTLNGLGQGLLSIPAGYITDRMGYIRGLLLGITITAVTSLVISVSATPLELFIAAAASGVGISFWTAASYPLMSGVMGGRLGLSSGLIVSSFGVGIFISPSLATYILHTYGGWRYPFLFLTLATTLLIPFSLYLLKGVKLHSAGERTISRWITDLRLLKFIPQITALAFMQFAYLALYVAYLRLAHGFEAAEAALAISPYGLGILVGGVLGVYISTRMRERQIVIMTSMLAMAAMLFIFNTEPTLISASLTSFGLGVLLGGVMFQTLIVGIQHSLPRNLLASSTGFFYTVLSFASIPPGYILGSMVSYMGWSMAGTVFYICTGILSLSGIAIEHLTRMRGQL
jgi:MFS family permease